MTFDEALAQRIRLLVADEAGVSERRMFGGLAFLVGGSVAVAASGQGGLLVRVGADASERLAAGPGVAPMVMRGRELRGWLHVTAGALCDEPELARFVGIGLAFARSLPAKP